MVRSVINLDTALGQVVRLISGVKSSLLLFKDPLILEKQNDVLKAVAQQPGSAVAWSDRMRAGDKPLRLRTIERLIELGDLEIRRADDYEGTMYLQLTVQGWDRVVKIDNP